MLRVSATVDYALRAALVLARAGGRPVTVAEIATSEQLPPKFLVWSLLGVYLSRLLMPVEDVGLVQLAGIAVASLALTTVVTLVACAAVGWIEDVAARRRPELWPSLGR